MQKTIVYQGRTVAYEFTYKRIKHIHARVRRDGSLAVSAPVQCSMAQIEQFLLRYMERLLRAMDRCCAEKAYAATGICEGQVVPIWGQAVRLHLAVGKQRSATLAQDTLTLCVRHGEGEKAYAALLADYLTKTAKTGVDAVCRRIYASFFDGMFSYPTIRYRRMVARWGSCCKAKALILLNTRLVFLPLPIVEYVVLHELVHMLHPNHSADFYRALGERMPDHRRRREQLNRVSLAALPWL